MSSTGRGGRSRDERNEFCFDALDFDRRHENAGCRHGVFLSPFCFSVGICGFRRIREMSAVSGSPSRCETVKPASRPATRDLSVLVQSRNRNATQKRPAIRRYVTEGSTFGRCSASLLRAGTGGTRKSLARTVSEDLTVSSGLFPGLFPEFSRARRALPRQASSRPLRTKAPAPALRARATRFFRLRAYLRPRRDT